MKRTFALIILWLWSTSLVASPQIPAATAGAPAKSVLSFATALQLAEQNAPVLRARTAAVNAANFARRPAAALPDPQLVLGASNVPATGSERGRLDQDLMTMQRIGIMQEVPSQAKRQARLALARAQVSEAEGHLEVERANVLREAAAAWLDLYYLSRRLPLFDELERELTLLTNVSQAQLATGTGSAIETLNAAEQVAALADWRDDTQRKISAAQARLQSLIGDQAFLPLATTAPALTVEPPQLRAHLHHHPELALYEPLTELAKARVQNAEAEKHSDWSLGVDYQHRAAPYDDMVSMEVRFALPLFPGTRQNPRIAAARQRLEALHSEREAMRRDHDAALATDLAAHQALVRQLERIAQSWLPLAQQAVTLATTGYRTGQLQLGDTLSARRNLINVRLRQIDLQHQRAVLAANLIYAYGAPQQ